MMVSFLSLGVIPALRLTNRGLVDGREFTLVDPVRDLTGRRSRLPRHGHDPRGEDGRDRRADPARASRSPPTSSTRPSGSIRCKDVEVHERDGDGARPASTPSPTPRCAPSARGCATPTSRRRAITWDQERGDVKAVHGWWRLEDLGSGRTRATYGLEVDPGRMLGLLLRGPAEGKVRDFLLDGAAEGLKERAEAR